MLSHEHVWKGILNEWGWNWLLEHALVVQNGDLTQRVQVEHVLQTEQEGGCDVDTLGAKLRVLVSHATVLL